MPPPNHTARGLALLWTKLAAGWELRLVRHIELGEIWELCRDGEKFTAIPPQTRFQSACWSAFHRGRLESVPCDSTDYSVWRRK